MSCSSMPAKDSPKLGCHYPDAHNTRPHMRPAHMKSSACGEASADCLCDGETYSDAGGLKIAGTIKVFCRSMCFRSDYQNDVI